MKSKVILFCILLFCSKIVDSVPYLDELERQRVQPSWPVDQNEPRQYRGSEFTQTENGKHMLTNSPLQNENHQEFYPSKDTNHYESFGYNNPSSLPKQPVSVNFGSPVDGSRMKSFLTEADSFPSKFETSRVNVDSRHYNNQNWNTENQYRNSASGDHGKLLVAPSQDSYLNTMQYLQKNYKSPENRQWNADGTYPTGEEYPYRMAEHYGNNVANTASRSLLRGSMKQENYNEDRATVSDDISAPVQSSNPVPLRIYNGAPVVINDAFVDNSRNARYGKNSEWRSGLSNIAYLNNYNEDSASTLSEKTERNVYPDNYRQSISNKYNDVSPPVISSNSAEKSRDNGYVQYYGSHDEMDNSAPVHKYNDASPVRTPTLLEPKVNKEYVNSYESNQRLSKLTPIDKYNDASPVKPETLEEQPVVNQSNQRSSNRTPVNKYNDAFTAVTDTNADKLQTTGFVQRYGSNLEPKNNAPENTNNNDLTIKTTDDRPKKIEMTKQVKDHTSRFQSNKPSPVKKYNEAPTASTDAPAVNLKDTSSRHNYKSRFSDSVQHPSPASILKTYEFKNIAANPKIESLLSQSKRRYMFMYANGTVAYMDKLDPKVQQNPNYHLIHADYIHRNKAKNNTEGIDLTTKSPLRSNIATTPAPKYATTLPINVSRNDNSPQPTNKVYKNPQIKQQDTNSYYNSSQPKLRDTSTLDNDSPVPNNFLNKSQFKPQTYSLSEKNPQTKPLTHSTSPDNQKVNPRDANTFDNSKSKPQNVSITKNIPQTKPSKSNKQSTSEVLSKSDDDSSPTFADSNESDKYPTSTKCPLTVQDYNTTPATPLETDEDSGKKTIIPSDSEEDSEYDKFPSSKTRPPFKKYYDKAVSSESDDDSNKYPSSNNWLLTQQDDDNDSEVKSGIPDDKSETPLKTTSKNSSREITTPNTNNNLSDEIITISPIELATDNVRDDTSEATTTSKPIKVHHDSNKENQGEDISTQSNKNNATDNENAQEYSTTKVPLGSSILSIGDIDSDFIIDIETFVDNTEPSDKQATLNSLTNTDVPAKRDGYSPVTTGPSVQSDIDTADTSTTPGDNPLEYTQFANDIKISLNATSDNEGDITISIEVLERTDDESSSNNGGVVINIDTKDLINDDSDTPSKGNSDCKKDKNVDDGKNVEIDFSNVKGEPTMIVKTSNEDYISKLISESTTNDFDIIYIFKVLPQPLVEKETNTTVYCNGTVVIEVTETTWDYSGDPSPKTVVTTRIEHIENYTP